MEGEARGEARGEECAVEEEEEEEADDDDDDDDDVKTSVLRRLKAAPCWRAELVSAIAWRSKSLVELMEEVEKDETSEWMEMEELVCGMTALILADKYAAEGDSSVIKEESGWVCSISSSSSFLGTDFFLGRVGVEETFVFCRAILDSKSTRPFTKLACINTAAFIYRTTFIKHSLNDWNRRYLQDFHAEILHPTFLFC